MRAASLSATAVAATIGVYGVVLGLVKADDLALHLMKKGKEKNSASLHKSGEYALKGLSVALRALPVVGTLAVLAVGGRMHAARHSRARRR